MDQEKDQGMSSMILSEKPPDQTQEESDRPVVPPLPEDQTSVPLESSKTSTSIFKKLVYLFYLYTLYIFAALILSIVEFILAWLFLLISSNQNSSAGDAGAIFLVIFAVGIILLNTSGLIFPLIFWIIKIRQKAKFNTPKKFWLIGWIPLVILILTIINTPKYLYSRAKQMIRISQSQNVADCQELYNFKDPFAVSRCQFKKLKVQHPDIDCKSHISSYYLSQSMDAQDYECLSYYAVQEADVSWCPYDSFHKEPRSDCLIAVAMMKHAPKTCQLLSNSWRFDHILCEKSISAASQKNIDLCPIVQEGSTSDKYSVCVTQIQKEIGN